MSCKEKFIKFPHFCTRLQSFLVYPDQGYQASYISLLSPFEMLEQGLNSQIHWKKIKKQRNVMEANINTF